MSVLTYRAQKTFQLDEPRQAINTKSEVENNSQAVIYRHHNLSTIKIIVAEST